MKKRITVLLLLFSSLMFSQEYTITGVVRETGTNENLEAATIYAESIKDSTLISYTISNKDGSFELELNTSLTEANLYLTYSGYQPVRKKIVLDKPAIDMGVLALQQQLQELEGVSVVAERTPIKIKKDTLEFNADSFKARPDANVEELLKKLPGVEVDSDGSITVNGRTVNRVLVNGKSFFGDDPKIATKNLPKEIIDKIQITDTKSETEEFTGKQSNSEEKTINITIKKDKNKGYFGRATVGYGTDERYQVGGMLNYFADNQRLNILASSNNINTSGFSYDEIFDMVGRGDNGVNMNFGQGITTSNIIGGSYANELKDDTEINGDYLYTGSSTFNDSKTFRENILPDRRYFTKSNSRFDGDTDSHKANVRFEFEIDSTLKITINPHFTLSKSLSRNQRDETALNSDNTLINESESLTVNDNEQKNFSNNLNIIKRLGSNGSYVKLGFNNSNNVNTGFGSIYTNREVYGDNPSQQEIDQQTETHNRTDSYSADIELRQPVVSRLFVDLGYRYGWNFQKNNRDVNDYDPLDNAYSDFNTDLSSDFRFKNIQQRSSLGINYEGEGLTVGVDANWQNTQMSNNDLLQGASFEKDFDNIFFTSRIRWRLSQSKRLRLDYRSSVNVPSLSQLQPIDNISNPTNIVTGNPELDPALSHRLSFGYNNFDWKSRSGMFLYGSFDLTDNEITRYTITDENFIRTTTYTNVNGNYRANAGAALMKQIKKDTTYTIGGRFRFNAGYNNDVSFNNGEKFTAKNYNITPGISLNLNFAELVDIEPGYSITFNNTSYNLDNMDDVSFKTHRVELRTSTYWPKNIIWGNDIAYNYNGNVGDGFDKSAVFWNMSLGVQMFKENATLKVLAYDLLNQNINTSRTATQNYIQDTQSTVLQQYFMLSFTYKFDRFGGKSGRGGMRPDGGRRHYMRF